MEAMKEVFIEEEMKFLSHLDAKARRSQAEEEWEYEDGLGAYIRKKYKKILEEHPGSTDLEIYWIATNWHHEDMNENSDSESE